jgi:hypothetical protein
VDALPDEVHHHQLYAYSGVGLPVQVPGLPVSVAPIADEPLIVRAELLTGGWTITVVVGEKFGVEPTELAARIFTRIHDPASAFAILYVTFVALLIGEQPSGTGVAVTPSCVHLYHAY